MPDGSDVIADIVCCDENDAILALIEGKVDVCLHLNQMKNYGQAFPSVPRILLAKARSQFSEPGQSEAEVFWNEVAEVLSDLPELPRGRCTQVSNLS